MLAACLETISERYELFEEAARQSGRIITNLAEYTAVTGHNVPYQLVYIDEVNVLLSSTLPKQLVARIDASLKRGLQLGRAAGVFYHVGAQYMTADLFDREGSKQFVTRAYFGAWDQPAMNMVFTGRVDKEWAKKYRHLLTGQPGRGVFAGIGGEPIPIQGVYVSEQHIIEAIRESGKASGKRSETPEMTFTASQFNPQICPDDEMLIDINPVPGDGSSSQTTKSPTLVQMARENSALREYLQQNIRRLKSEGKGKKEIIHILFGVKPGGREPTDRYPEASAFYDEAIGRPC